MLFHRHYQEEAKRGGESINEGIEEYVPEVVDPIEEVSFEGEQVEDNTKEWARAAWWSMTGLWVGISALLWLCVTGRILWKLALPLFTEDSTSIAVRINEWEWAFIILPFVAWGFLRFLEKDAGRWLEEYRHAADEDELSGGPFNHLRE